MIQTVRCLIRSCSARQLPRCWTHSSATSKPSVTVKDRLAMPTIPLQEYQDRRIRLQKAVYALPAVSDFDNHIFVLPSAQVKHMAIHDVAYVFHQDTYFRYLCGFPDPNSALVISIDKSSSEPSSHLFVKSRSASQAMWNGPTLGVAGAQSFLTNGVHELDELDSFLKGLLKESSNTAVWFDHDSTVNFHLRQPITNVISEASVDAIFDPKSVIDLLRLVKSPSEMEAMRAAARIGGEAMTETMRFCAQHMDDMSEFKLWAKMDFESRMRGSLLAYPPVVGGGNNANIFHYIDNNQPVRPGELVLMDAGSQCDGYCSDITRTWPVNGRFTNAQRTVYEVVLRVLDSCIELVSPDVSLNDLNIHMLTSLSRELKAAGVIKTKYRWTNDFELGRQICSHHVGHWLGLDIHDGMSVPLTLNLTPGVVFPLEPGAYFPIGCSFVKEDFVGIGIRVEDDIAMTSEGVEVLTKTLARTPDDIEALMRS